MRIRGALILILLFLPIVLPTTQAEDDPAKKSPAAKQPLNSDKRPFFPRQDHPAFDDARPERFNGPRPRFEKREPGAPGPTKGMEEPGKLEKAKRPAPAPDGPGAFGKLGGIKTGRVFAAKVGKRPTRAIDHPDHPPAPGSAHYVVVLIDDHDVTPFIASELVNNTGGHFHRWLGELGMFTADLVPEQVKNLQDDKSVAFLFKE